MLEYGDYNTLPIRTPRPFDLVSDFISRVGLVHWILMFYCNSLLYGCARMRNKMQFLLNYNCSQNWISLL